MSLEALPGEFWENIIWIIVGTPVIIVMLNFGKVWKAWERLKNSRNDCAGPVS